MHFYRNSLSKPNLKIHMIKRFASGLVKYIIDFHLSWSII